ncbi:hypothetical protein M3193_03720 [Sporosarcina luteola]|uniref:hypothetical protein n=1 Tax=Sporosarcina luteola TaxID=582850 RepID=UPI00203DF6D6|nr:hypothetical protein [Sporosarcina luteola]MCM3743241.1 hypothetical protein [Sporosarcina luteola]
MVNVINPDQNKKQVVVDACISIEVQMLNDRGVVTLASCCGHGKAGEIIEWENDFGKWKSFREPPHALISEDSVELVKELGYKPIPYYYADGRSGGAWTIMMKSGCVTELECKEWHEENSIPL